MTYIASVVQHIAQGARVDHAQAAIRTVHGKHASRWLAAQAGISPRTARRWLSSAAPTGRTRAILDAAATAGGATGLAAQRLRTAETIDVGTVAVSYDGDDEGNRRVGEITVEGDVANYLITTARDLEAHNLEGAADAFSNAIMSGYDPGLEDTLQVEAVEFVDVSP
ncbi:hypothetical protein [Amycolatopsis sp. PS_44_ISF1]|uniref:hypothetical protein n=1 Tax=Amycolatopsis sp. PS_44_ISF1 TaxID=2974917 RepID=UPI0028E0597B|nr:hypothetical protein [Amycolatopsis sp. PS_44_ISF1]MDT8916222.1 hypothetical protein [Amycolatopsis sp. PS_44_ISF1]